MFDSLENLTHINKVIIQNIFYSFIIIIVFYIIRKLVLNFIINRVDETKYRYFYSKVLTYLIVFITTFFISIVWLKKLQSISTIIGIFSAGLAIIFKDFFLSILGWIFIILRKPFELGDRIQVGDIKGDVVDIRIFMFTLIEVGNWVDSDQSTGRLVHIPNYYVYTKPLYNYYQGLKYIWNEINVVITFESNWEKAKQILTEILNTKLPPIDDKIRKYIRKTTARFMIHFNILDPKVYTSVVDNGVKFSLRYLCDPKQRRGTSEILWEEILKRFDKEKDIDLAYPTTRFYTLNEQQNKKDAK